MKRSLRVVSMGLLMAGFAASAQAAFITVDDSDVNNITITAGDFENGFSINGNLLTSGLGDSGSITFADGGFNISGSWIDLGQTVGLDADLLFFDAGDSSAIKSGIEVTGTTDGQFGSISGSFGGYTGLTYFFGLGAFEQNDGIQFAALPFLSISFTPEPTATGVPDAGSSALLMSLATAGLAMFGRRFRA